MTTFEKMEAIIVRITDNASPSDLISLREELYYHTKQSFFSLAKHLALCSEKEYNEAKTFWGDDFWYAGD